MDTEHARHQPDTLRIVLVGTTDIGKSSAGNTICGERVFMTRSRDEGANFSSQKETTNFDGQLLTIVDTPGLFDPNRSNEEVEREIANGVALAAPGPHVLLVVFQPGKFRNLEQETKKIIQEMFGEEAACYTMALFTHGDLRRGKSVEELIVGSPDLRAFISQCGGECHVFNNRDEDPSQVRELLEKINTMVQRNGGSYYTKDLRQKSFLKRIKRANAGALAGGASAGAAAGAALAAAATTPTASPFGPVAAAAFFLGSILGLAMGPIAFGAALGASLGGGARGAAGACDGLARGAAAGAVVGAVAVGIAVVAGPLAVAIGAVIGAVVGATLLLLLLF